MSFRDTENTSLCAAESSKPTARSPPQSGSSAPTPSDEISFLGYEQEHVASSPQNKLEQPDYVEKRRYPGTTYAVLGCYSTAWLLATLHYCFFRFIDGEELSDSILFQQSRVSTISLLLVTIFRAVVVATLSICFTQYLWYSLRKNSLKISLIEDLFQIRSNIWTLASPKVIRKAPLLFVMAALSWLVPLATIYPPTALTIQSELHTTFTNVNASTMNSTLAFELEATLAFELEATPKANSLALFQKGATRSNRGNVSENRILYNGPDVPIINLAKLVLSSGQIISIAPLKGENSSYALTFAGPLVQCSSQTPTKITIIDDEPDRKKVVVYNGTWPHLGISDNQPVFNLIRRRVAGYYPAPIMLPQNCSDGSNSCLARYYPGPDMPVTMVFEERTLLCEAYTTTYSVNISYIKGIQRIEYTTDNAKRLQDEYKLSLSWNENGSRITPTDTEEYKRWQSTIPPWKEKANIRAILDSVGYNLEYQWSLVFSRVYYNETETYLLPDGTETALGMMTRQWFPGNWGNNYTTLQDSALNLARFGPNASFEFDPRDSFNITEGSINELLANVTISALSLNTWYGSVNVTDRVSRNVYRFSHPPSLLVPYGLCLFFTLLCIALGLNALQLNGISATDGGFLQIMMTTTGDTEMSRSVQGGSLGGSGNAPKELLELKVRFGKLVDQEGAASTGRYGFGTADETELLLRRRK